MTAWALTTGVVRLMSTGDALRPQLHIDDLTGLTVHVLGMDDRRMAAISAKPLNVGATASNYSIRELAEIVASRVEGAQVRKDPDAWVDARSYRVNFDRLASDIPDFPIRRDVESSIPEIASRYARLGLDEDDVRSLRYTRIQQLKRARELGALDSELRTPRPSAATLDAE
jgi:nucleoside-diphosphate-sugar epimerase